MEKNFLNLGFNTADTFTAADGTIVSYQDLFEGALRNILCHATREGRSIDSEDLRDAAQEAFKRIWLHSGTFDPSKSRRPQDFGNRVAENCIYDVVEKVSRYATTFTPLEVPDGNKGSDRGWKTLYEPLCPDDEFAPDRDLLREEEETEQEAQKALMYRAIKGLKRDQQEILQLYLDGYTSSEMAEILGCTPSAADSRLNRARTALCNSLAGVSGDHNSPEIIQKSTA